MSKDRPSKQFSAFERTLDDLLAATETDALEQAWQDLDAKIAALTAPRNIHGEYATSIGYEPYAVSLLRSAGAELLHASDALRQSAEQLKWAGKGQSANLAIKASRRAREAAQGLA